MKSVLMAVLFLIAAASAEAAVLTFDDITDDVGINVSVPDGYGGLNWTDIKVHHQNYLESASGYDNATVSGYYVAYNSWADAATADSSIFDFNGVYLTAAWNDGLKIQVQGWNNGEVIYTQTVTVSTSEAIWFSFNFLGIDKVTFSSGEGKDAGFSGGSGTHFAMDNFTINETQPDNRPMPEPSTVILFGAGMLAVGIIGRKKNRK